MRLVILESPFAGDTARNIIYARLALRDSLSRGEAPLASHLLYTQPGILRDEVPSERKWGIDAGLAWALHATATVIYTDLGISRGMEYGILNARAASRPIEYRRIGAQGSAQQRRLDKLVCDGLSDGIEAGRAMTGDPPKCPRCAELRGRSVKMQTIAKGPPEQSKATAYECPSCDYVTVLQPMAQQRA
jgi:hypothetical protein